MKTIKLKSMELSFFKGIKNLYVEFNDKVTNVFGDNGTGKTTIADAFFWCLFGKDSLGHTKFRIRTIGAESAETYVSINLVIDGITRNIKRSLILNNKNYSAEQAQEQSVSSRFLVDGQQMTKKDFEQFLSDVISEDTFRIVTSPTYFLSLKWNEQRSLLQNITNDDITDAEINNAHQFDLIEDVLHTQFNGNIEALRKHYDYQIKQIKEALDRIPIQQAEVERNTPENKAWSLIESQIVELKNNVKDKEKQITSLRAGISNANTDTIRHQIEFQQSRIDNIRKSARNMYAENCNKYDEEGRQLSSKRAEYIRSLNDLNAKLEGIESRISQYNLTIDEQKKEQEEIRNLWALRVNASYKEPDVDITCPTCGQPLPQSKINEVKEKHYAEFMKNKAEAKKSLTEKATMTKALIKRAENDIKSFEEELVVLKAQIVITKQYIGNLDESIKKWRDKTPMSIEEMIANNEGYSQAIKMIDQLNDRLLSPSKEDNDNSEQIEKLEDEVMALSAEIERCQASLAEREIYDRCIARLDELNTTQNDLRKQYDEFVRRQDLTISYQLRAGEILESHINKHFSLVKFSLFRHLVNGSVEPYCEAYVDGVPYNTNVNSASRLNAGLDICNAFCKHLGISAPVITDNAESTNNILETIGQQIRLYVSHDKQLLFK